MKTTAYLTLVFGTIAFLSGIMGFLHAHQLLGLYIEIPGSIILIISALYMIQKKKKAYWIALLTCLVLFGYFAYFFAATTKFFPGLLGGLSLFLSFIITIHVLHIGEID